MSVLSDSAPIILLFVSYITKLIYKMSELLTLSNWICQTPLIVFYY